MPETTVMKDSVVGDAWIKAACEANPVQRVLDASGNPTGNFLTGPVRLAFVESVFHAKPQMSTDPNSKLKHSINVLFTPFTDMSLLWEEYYRICGSDFASFYNSGISQYVGLDNPIVDQALKSHKYSGFTPGLWSTNMTSNFKPPVTDMVGNPIVDESQIYAGVWAIVAFNTYASGKNFPKKGPRFGLQAIMKIGDDKPLSGGAIDAKVAFGNVKVQAPTAIAPGAFGRPAGAPPAGAPPAAAYYPPGGIPAATHMAPPPRPGAPPALPPAAAADEDLSQFM